MSLPWKSQNKIVWSGGISQGVLSNLETTSSVDWCLDTRTDAHRLCLFEDITNYSKNVKYYLFYWTLLISKNMKYLYLIYFLFFTINKYLI